MPLAVPFLLLSAFTSSPDSGNPAAVVFLPFSVISYPTEKLQAIATNFAQPITTFVSALPETAAEVNTNEDTGVQADFAIRWFTVNVEVPLCGHGTLAAAKAIFGTPGLTAQVNGKSKPNDRVNGNKSRDENLLTFQTITGPIVSARKTTVTLPKTASEVEQIQISFPHAPTVPIDPASPAGAKIRSALGKALQKPAGDVNIVYMGRGEGSFKDYLFVDLGKDETLQGREIVTDAFRESGFGINVVTTPASPSSTGDEVFLSRMFAPSCGVPEDQVCGSAHCLLVPYWAPKRLAASSANGPTTITLETPMIALQVSQRGGMLFVSWDTKEGVAKIGGEVVVWGKGEVFV